MEHRVGATPGPVELPEIAAADDRAAERALADQLARVAGLDAKEELAAVHFEETCRYFYRCKVTGVPVRRAFFNLPPKPAGSPPTLLVFGGSQGAHAINEVVMNSLAALVEQISGIRPASDTFKVNSSRNSIGSEISSGKV